MAYFEFLTNWLLIETVYAAVIIIASLIILFKAHKLYSFSKYRGISYFSYAFLFLAAGFTVRYIVILQATFIEGSVFYLLILMQFFMMMPGFFLLYSFIWKHLSHHIYIATIPLLYMLIALTISLIDFLNQSFLLLYISQVVLFMAAVILSAIHYYQRRTACRKYILCAMSIFLLVWIINFIGHYTKDMFSGILIGVYAATAIAALVFLVMVSVLTRDFGDR